MFDEIEDIDAVVPASFIDSLPLPDDEKARFKKYAKLGMTFREFDALLEQSEYTPVMVVYDFQTNHRMTQEQIDMLLAQAQRDLQAGMMAKEVALLLMKGLVLVGKAQAGGVL